MEPTEGDYEFVLDEQGHNQNNLTYTKEEQEKYGLSNMDDYFNSLDLEQYKKYILERNCKLANTVTYSLEQYLNVDSWIYGMYYKDDLLNLGFTKQDMDGFIADKYEELVKQKEEDEDE